MTLHSRAGKGEKRHFQRRKWETRDLYLLLACDYICYIIKKIFREKSVLQSQYPPRKKSKAMLIPSQEIYSVNMSSQVIGLFVCFLINWSSCFQFISIATGLNTVWFTAKILIYFMLEIILTSPHMVKISIKYRFRRRTWVFNCMAKTHFYLGQGGTCLRKSSCSGPCSPSIGVTPHIQLYLSVRDLLVY